MTNSSDQNQRVKQLKRQKINMVAPPQAFYEFQTQGSFHSDEFIAHT